MGAGGTGRQPALSPRTPSSVQERDNSELMPLSLANDLRQLAQWLPSCEVNAASFGQLSDLLDRLHHAQEPIETALRHHAGQDPLPALGHALFDFITRLNHALQGKPGKPVENVPDQPPPDQLPLNWLSIPKIEKLCLGLSSLAYRRSRQPFSADQFFSASTILASITERLMQQVAACGGVASMSSAQMLDISNMARRFIGASMIDLDQDSQQATRTFLEEEFATFLRWAAHDHLLDSAHDLGKVAAQVLSMVQHGPNPAASDLTDILNWLVSKPALKQLLEADHAVAFSSVLALVARLLQGGHFKADDGEADAMYLRVIECIACWNPAALVAGDGRILACHANLLRVLMHSGLPEAWLQAKQQARQQPDPHELVHKYSTLISQFEAVKTRIREAILVRIKGAIDLHDLSNLLSFLKAAHRSASTAERGAITEEAARLADALPQGSFKGLRSGRELGGLLLGLGYFYKHGPGASRSSFLPALLALLPVLGASHGWEASDGALIAEVLLTLLERGAVDIELLQPTMNAVWGAKPGGEERDENDLRSLCRKSHSVQKGKEWPLQPDEGIESVPTQRCSRAPSLVGTTQAQQAAAQLGRDAEQQAARAGVTSTLAVSLSTTSTVTTTTGSTVITTTTAVNSRRNPPSGRAGKQRGKASKDVAKKHGKTKIDRSALNENDKLAYDALQLEGALDDPDPAVLKNAIKRSTSEVFDVFLTSLYHDRPLEYIAVLELIDQGIVPGGMQPDQQTASMIGARRSRLLTLWKLKPESAVAFLNCWGAEEVLLGPQDVVPLMYHAIRNAPLEWVKAALRRPRLAQVVHQDYVHEGITFSPFLHAASRANSDLLKLLLERHIPLPLDPAYMVKALCAAVGSGGLKALEVLIADERFRRHAGDVLEETTPFERAVLNKQDKMALALVQCEEVVKTIRESYPANVAGEGKVNIDASLFAAANGCMETSKYLQGQRVRKT